MELFVHHKRRRKGVRIHETQLDFSARIRLPVRILLSEGEHDEYELDDGHVRLEQHRNDRNHRDKHWSDNNGCVDLDRPAQRSGAAAGWLSLLRDGNALVSIMITGGVAIHALSLS